MDGLKFPRPIPRERKRKWGQRKEPRRKSRLGYDPGREEFARSLPCVGSSDPAHICRGGDVQASHDRNPMGGLPTGLGRKENSRRTIPMCPHNHLAEWERHAGMFDGWDSEKRHYWMQDRINEVNLLWDALTDEAREMWQGEAELARRRRAEALRGT